MDWAGARKWREIEKEVLTFKLKIQRVLNTNRQCCSSCERGGLLSILLPCIIRFMGRRFFQMILEIGEGLSEFVLGFLHFCEVASSFIQFLFQLRNFVSALGQLPFCRNAELLRARCVDVLEFVLCLALA